MENYKDLRATINKHKQKKNEFQHPRRKQQGTERANWTAIQKNSQEQVKEEDRKRASTFPEMEISDDKDKKSFSILAESMESGRISSASYKTKTGSDKLFVTCLNNNSENKIG